MGRLRTPQSRLTDRESDVLKTVAAGETNRQAAAALHMSEATVKTRLAHSFQKFGASSRTAAVAKANGLGMI
ncbi:response regulator transcription factor [Dietzia sp. NPDC055340]|uniref:response regulator transcription factor n=1 Tax=Arthrobacter koreensis TaxID=199136 RepID=UPI003672E0E1